jgi:hypothetical protein
MMDSESNKTRLRKVEVDCDNVYDNFPPTNEDVLSKPELQGLWYDVKLKKDGCEE